MAQNLSTGIRLLNAIGNPEGHLFICLYDFNKDQFVVVSDNCKTIFGYEREEMEGYPASDFTLSKYKAHLQETIRNNAENNAQSAYVNIYVCKDGTKKLMHWGADKVINGVGLAYALVVSNDYLDTMNVLKDEL